MASPTLAPLDPILFAEPCGRCLQGGSPWDRIGGSPLCPDCQENLIQGRSPPLMIRPQTRACHVCARVGTLNVMTLPLNVEQALELDLCPIHLHAFLARGLEQKAFLKMRRQLRALGLKPGQVFLLHEAFYDRKGRALQPAE